MMTRDKKERKKERYIDRPETKQHNRASLKKRERMTRQKERGKAKRARKGHQNDGAV